MNWKTPPSLSTPVEGGEGASTQVENAIQQAQQVAVTAHLPMAWTLVEDRLDFVLTPTIGVTWTRLDRFVFPSIRLNSVATSVDEKLFDAELLPD